MKSNEKTYFAARNREKTSEIAVYDTFNDYLQSKNILEKHIKKYVLQVDFFAEWLQTNKQKQPETAEKKDLLDYLHYLLETRNYSISTRQHTLGTLRHYYTFLYKSDQTQTNPTLLINLRGVNRKLLKKILSLQEMEELLDVYFNLKVRNAKQATNTLGRFEECKHIKQRNHLVLSLFVHQGIKQGELLTLKLDDLDLQKAVLNVRELHKSNARTLPLKATQIGLFYEYLHQSRPLFNRENDLLFNVKPCLHLLATDLKKIYPKFTDYTQLRSSVITHWIQTEGLRKAQYNAGHRYISSTERFIANDLESLKNDINNFHPL